MANLNNFKYVGSELDLFVHAVNWKSYWSSLIKNYIKGDVLEVGAGNGNNTQLLNSKNVLKWVCLEPDNELTKELSKRNFDNPCCNNIDIINGTIADLGKELLFDTIIYIDVLEHIENDKEELIKASKHLRKGGNLIILSPALQQLYSEFDKAIGHFRRYTKNSLKEVIPVDFKVQRLIYLDSIGVAMSMANRILLKQSAPELKQIKLWDRFIIPCSKYVDYLLGYKCGKSILAILNKPK